MPQCVGKVRYPSRLVALMQALRCMEREDNPPEALRPYRCNFCRGWHLTSRVDINEGGYTVRRPSGQNVETLEKEK